MGAVKRYYEEIHDLNCRIVEIHRLLCRECRGQNPLFLIHPDSELSPTESVLRGQLTGILNRADEFSPFLRDDVGTLLSSLFPFWFPAD